MNKERHNVYHKLLLKWQKTINLVSPATLDNAWDRHFIDSIQLVKYIPDNVKTICDIGSGAGFPGLVMAIERPDIEFHFIESDVRKCTFLRTVSRETSCENVTIHNDRIEKTIDVLDVNIDMVSARALASVRQLISYAEPLWSQNKSLSMLLPKGQNWQEEIEDAQVKYAFDVLDFESETDKNARILIVNNIAEK